MSGRLKEALLAFVLSNRDTKVAGYGKTIILYAAVLKYPIKNISSTNAIF
jgi:hypothetical protein